MKRVWLLLGVALLAACGKEGGPAATTAVAPPAPRFDPASLAHGMQLYEANCVQCHGPRGEGHPDWQTPSDGKFAAAPPLNGTGNDWKRTRAELAATIKNGVRRKSDKTDIMPAWKGRFSDRDVDDVINYMQSLWPAEVYEAWSKAQAPAPGAASAPKG